MKKNFSYIYILAFVAIIFTGCEDEVNQWDIEPGHDRLFRSLIFDVVAANPTSVEVKYTKVVSADKYIFEFSEDSLLFNEIVMTKEVMTDTLTPFSSSTTETRTEYRSIFDELSGTTGYSIRMYGLDMETGLRSDYSQLYFETGAEQIFTSHLSYTDKIQMFWTPTDQVSAITVSDPATGEVVVEKTLSKDEISAAAALLEGLVPGTHYVVTIYNNTRIRGTMAIKTSGLVSGAIVEVEPTDAIADVMSEAVAAGNSDITLVFSGATPYEIGSLTIPSGVESVSFTGMPDSDGSLPVINMTELRFSDLVLEDLILENVEVTGDYGKYFIYLSSDNIEVDNIVFRSCKLSDFRSIVRLSNNLININSVKFDDCLIHNTGGYGVINIGGSTPSVDTLSFTNSTLTEIATQLMDVRAAVPQIIIGNCTFVNLSSSLSQLLRFDTKQLPLAVTTENNIISGNNGGAQINSLSFDMTTTGLNVSFGGSYKTADLEINKYDFANITVFDGTTYDLFVDPDNRDFTIKTESGFGGRGVAGDPRWFE